MKRWPEELKVKLFNEYQEGKLGYKRLGQKYGLTRDNARYLIVSMKEKHYTPTEFDSRESDAEAAESKRKIAAFVKERDLDAETKALIERLRIERDYYKLMNEVWQHETAEDERKKKQSKQ